MIFGKTSHNYLSIDVSKDENFNGKLRIGCDDIVSYGAKAFTISYSIRYIYK